MKFHLANLRCQCIVIKSYETSKKNKRGNHRPSNRNYWWGKLVPIVRGKTLRTEIVEKVTEKVLDTAVDKVADKAKEELQKKVIDKIFE